MYLLFNSVLVFEKRIAVITWLSFTVSPRYSLYVCWITFWPWVPAGHPKCITTSTNSPSWIPAKNVPPGISFRWTAKPCSARSAIVMRRRSRILLSKSRSSLDLLQTFAYKWLTVNILKPTDAGQFFHSCAFMQYFEVHVFSVLGVSWMVLHNIFCFNWKWDDTTFDRTTLIFI